MEAKIVMPGDGRNLNVIGDNQFIKLTGADTGGAFTLIKQVNAVGAGIPPHVHHDEEETFFILEERYEFKVAGKVVDAPAGTTIFLPRGTPHAFKVVEGAPARGLIMLCPAGGEKMFAELSTLSLLPDMGRVQAICAKYGVKFL